MLIETSRRSGMKRKYADARTQANYEAALKRRSIARLRRNRLPLNIRTGGFLGLENKFYDTSIAYTSFSAAETWQLFNPGTVNCISAPAQGDGESNRDGRKFVITSMHIKGAWRLPTTVNQTQSGTYPSVRIIVYLDKQANGAVPTISQIVQDTGDINSFRNLQYTKRFDVLKDRTYFFTRPQVYDGTNIEWGQVVRQFKFNKKFKTPLEVNMNNTSAGVSGVVDHAIGIVAVSTADDVAVKYSARIRFKG